MFTCVQIRDDCPICHKAEYDGGNGWHTLEEAKECRDGYVYEWVDAETFIAEHQNREDQE